MVLAASITRRSYLIDAQALLTCQLKAYLYSRRTQVCVAESGDRRGKFYVPSSAGTQSQSIYTEALAALGARLKGW